MTQIQEYTTPEGITIRKLPSNYSEGLREEYFSCICLSDEHTIRFVYFEDVFDKTDGTKECDAELYLTVFLDGKPWYKRLWIGIKYIFGHKSKYGHFGNWTLVPRDINRLKTMLTKFSTFYNLEPTNKTEIEIDGLTLANASSWATGHCEKVHPIPMALPTIRFSLDCTQTGIGPACFAKCITCGAEQDITDYGSW